MQHNSLYWDVSQVYSRCLFFLKLFTSFSEHGWYLSILLSAKTVMFVTVFDKFTLPVPSVPCQNSSELWIKRKKQRNKEWKFSNWEFISPKSKFLCVYVQLMPQLKAHWMRIPIFLASGHRLWLNTSNIPPDCLLIIPLQGAVCCESECAYKQTGTPQGFKS